MTKKYLLSKAVAAAMMFAGLMLTSCDENDNAIINGEVYVKPEVQLVDGGAVVTANTIADINRMIGRLNEAIKEAADAGETFTVNIEAPALDATATENTISILTPNGADIVVNFTNPISTDEPLVIESKGVSDDTPSAASTNEVEINFAAGTSNIDLNLFMPASTVTLKGGTFNELTTTTANNTLILESGITIDWLNVKGGHVLVQDGATINGIILETGYVTNKGAYKPDAAGQPSVYYIDENKEEQAYYAKKVKLAKILNANGDVAVSHLAIANQIDEAEDVEVIISDGAKAFLQFYMPFSGVPTIASVIGEGDATIVSTQCTYIKKLKNVTLEPWSQSQLALPQNCENCIFKSYGFKFQYDTYKLFSENTTVTFKNCEFVHTLDSDLPQIINTQLPYMDTETGFTSFEIRFDNCTFKKLTQFNINKKMYDDEAYQYTLTFNGTKIGDQVITGNTELISDMNYFDEAHPQPLFNIDGKTYQPQNTAGVWSLVEAE